MIAGLLDVADTASAWASLAGPPVMPARLTVCAGASSLSVTALSGVSVGASLMALTVTVKVRVILLLLPWPSFTVTVIVTGPFAAVFMSATGVNDSVPVLPLAA